MKIVVTSLVLVVLLATCAADWNEGIFDVDDKRQTNGKSAICLERNDKCELGGIWSCCRGLACQKHGLGSQRRCELSAAQTCIPSGQSCNSIPGSRKCCGLNTCSSNILGNTICK